MEDSNPLDPEWETALLTGMKWEDAKELDRKRRERAAAVAKRLLGNQARSHEVNPDTDRCVICGGNGWTRRGYPDCNEAVKLARGAYA